MYRPSISASFAFAPLRIASARLFSAAPGFLKTELWRSADGSFLTADHWRSEADFDRFQQSLGEEYHRLDAELEEVAGVETFLGAFDLVD